MASAISFISTLVLINLIPAMLLAWDGRLPSDNEDRRTSPLVNSGSNSQETTPTPRDVAVTGINASTQPVFQGGIVSIDVTVENLGSQRETFTLVLQDDTDNSQISSETLTLESSQRLTIKFDWDTGTATNKAHWLTASTNLAGDENPANDTKTLEQPITVVQEGITLGDGTGLETPDAFFDVNLLHPNIETQVDTLSTLFIAAADSRVEEELTPVIVGTGAASKLDVFVANADAIFQPATSFQNPFSKGEIQGIVHLEGETSSVGISVLLGASVHHVNADGSFRFDAPPGVEDIVIQAPGHVQAKIPEAKINAGELLTLPELTLPFGDANGDGTIDIWDLSMAADNFGATVEEIPLP